jgi:hypothetical protein
VRLLRGIPPSPLQLLIPSHPAAKPMNEQSAEVRSVTCSHCQQGQFVKIQPIFNIRFMYGQSIQCIRCKRTFDVTLPYQIIDGPYADE